MNDLTANPFQKLYEDPGSAWGGQSGPGSDAYHTVEYRAMLDKFIRENGVRSIVDLGCGDWQFMRFMNLDGTSYLGMDVVPSVVKRNQQRFTAPHVSFDLVPPSLTQIPSADLLIMKDVLQHLSNQQILEHRDRLFGKFRFCLLTNSYRKLDTPTNIDIAAGDFRCLDLTAAPYHVRGAYILEFGSPIWERLRTLLIVNG